MITHFLTPMLGECSHCYLHPDVTDGPCIASSTGDCRNQLRSKYCSLVSGSYIGPCKVKPPGDFSYNCLSKIIYIGIVIICNFDFYVICNVHFRMYIPLDSSRRELIVLYSFRREHELESSKAG